MRPFLPPSPTLSFPSFRSKPSRSPIIPSVSSLPASFNLRRRQPRRIQSLSQLNQAADLLPGSSPGAEAPAGAPFRKGHRKSKSSGGSGGSMSALQMANEMLPAGLRLTRRDSVLPFASVGDAANNAHEAGEAEAGSSEVYDDSDLAIESALAAIWNSGCLVYLVSPDDSDLPPAPSPLFDTLRLVILALVLLPLLLSLSTGARCLSAKLEPISPEKKAGVWASTVGSGVGIFLWSRYVTDGWSLSSPWVAYQALILAIAIVGVVYNSIVRRPRTIEELEDEVEPLEYTTPPGSPRAKAISPVSPVGTPVRGTPFGSRENLVAMLA